MYSWPLLPFSSSVSVARSSSDTSRAAAGWPWAVLETGDSIVLVESVFARFFGGNATASAGLPAIGASMPES